MAYCPRCGEDVGEDDKFCLFCGAPISPDAAKDVVHERADRWEREVCFGVEERERDRMGLVSFGIFLLVVGFIYLSNPNVFSDLRLWFIGFRDQVFRPPGRLLASAVLFFGLIGLSSFLLAGLRLTIDRARRRALADALRGIALSSFAYLIHLYGKYSLTWQMVVGMEVVVCGLLLVLYSVVGSYLITTRSE